MQDEQYLIDAAAFLRAKGHKYEIIASILNLSSTATVDALLKKAKSQGLFSEKVEFIYAKIPPTRLQQLRYLDYVEILGGHLRSASPKMRDNGKHSFRQLYVVDSGTSDESERMYPTRQTRFGLEAAPIICELLAHSHTVGVAWGSTLRACAKINSDFLSG